MRYGHHIHKFPDAEHTILLWVDGILCCKLIVTSMNTLNESVPRLPRVLVSIFASVFDPLTINYTMWPFCRIGIIKRRFTLFKS